MNDIYEIINGKKYKKCGKNQIRNPDTLRCNKVKTAKISKKKLPSSKKIYVENKKIKSPPSPLPVKAQVKKISPDKRQFQFGIYQPVKKISPPKAPSPAKRQFQFGIYGPAKKISPPKAPSPKIPQIMPLENRVPGLNFKPRTPPNMAAKKPQFMPLRNRVPGFSPVNEARKKNKFKFNRLIN